MNASVLPGLPLERARRLLCRMQDHIREILISARGRGTARLSAVAAVTVSDTIYRIDRISEEAIFAWFERHWPRDCPVEIVMEGIDQGSAHSTFPAGTRAERTLVKCIIDPIDGTRCLMYDKRSAWMLCGLAPQRGEKNELRDLVVAAMTELPTSKQGRAEQWSAIRGKGRRGVVGASVDLRTGRSTSLKPEPSRAKDCRHGFASFAKFFPEGKALIAKIEEELWARLYGDDPSGSPVIFDDQYPTTGGQIHELLSGRDRMIADIRPIVFNKLRLKSGLVCHPYDICTALILTEAGGVVEAPMGGPLKIALDTTTPVAWVGYANPTLARRTRPVLRRILQEQL